jgi:hypothetical protein
MARGHLRKESQPDLPLAGVQFGFVLLVLDVQVFLGFLDLLLEVRGQGTRSFRKGLTRFR